MIALFFLRVQELSHEITISHDQSGMQHELLHHFVQALGKNSDSSLTRSVLLPSILKIKQLRRSPTHPMIPLPFTYHDVLFMLRDAEITHFSTVTGRRLPHLFLNNVPGVHDPVVEADQMRPNNSPQAQGRPYLPCPFPKADGAPIRCELCLDRFGLSGNDAPWCLCLHPDNIKDREIKQHVLQFKITHYIKQDAVPEKLNEAIKSRPFPNRHGYLSPSPASQRLIFHLMNTVTLKNFCLSTINNM
jgi:hypothetical protein